MARFAATMNAINKGLETTKPDKGVGLIEDWESAVADLDYPGAKGIARDLGALRKALEKPEPDAERIEALLHRLGQATVKIAERADKQQDKVRELGEALSEAGVEQGDEEEDAEAKAAPQRRRKAANDGKDATRKAA
jgi:hypothetical protein